MGNKLSPEELSERSEYVEKMRKMKFDILDIGNKNGATGYLDFITPDDISSNAIMKGTDCLGRPFFVFKAHIELSNGDVMSTFSTFFQRFFDDRLCWHICGHYGENLLFTEGGTNNTQFQMLCELFETGKYELSEELRENSYDNLRLNWRQSKYREKYDDSGEIIETDKVFPVSIKLG